MSKLKYFDKNMNKFFLNIIRKFKNNIRKEILKM